MIILFIIVENLFLKGKLDNCGFWCISIKSDNIDNPFELLPKKISKKTVYKIDPKTNNIIDKYYSIAICCNVLNCDMYGKVRARIIHDDGYRYCYKNKSIEAQIG